jgi:hypothetical protein
MSMANEPGSPVNIRHALPLMIAPAAELAQLLAQPPSAAASAAKSTPLAPLTSLAPLFSPYQPETQFAFFVERLMEVNLYSRPTLKAKFTSYCA